MHVILFRALAHPGQRDQLLDFLARDAAESSSERFTQRFDVMPDPGNDHAFYVYESYTSRASFEQEHKRGRAYGEWATQVKPGLADFSILFEGTPAAMLNKHLS
jgi:quinol monooxygenase YgiN